MNYYPFHIGDYASATRHLSWDEDMAYRRLMDAYYTREEPIPLDRRQAYRLVCATSQEQRDAVDIVLAEFFEETPDGWRNERCDAEIEACRAKSEKAAQSAQARWRNATGKRTESGRNANAPETGCERIEEACGGNAPKTNTKTNISEPNGSDDGARKPRPTRKCPGGFVLTPEMREWAAAKAPLVNIESATEAFRDHTFKNAITDWAGAWRNWMRRDQQFAAEKQRPARIVPARENFDAKNYGEMRKL